MNPQDCTILESKQKGHLLHALCWTSLPRGTLAYFGANMALQYTLQKPLNKVSA